MIALMAVSVEARGTPETESLGDKIKRFFAGPTPTPKPKRHKKSTAKKKSAPTPLSSASESPSVSPSISPTPTASPSVAATATPNATSTPTPKATPTPTATARPTVAPSPVAGATTVPPRAQAATAQSTATATQQTPTLPAASPPRQGRGQYFEPVRPIAPAPYTKSRPGVSPPPPVETPLPTVARALPIAAPTSPTASATPTPAATATATPSAKSTRAPTSTISAADVIGYDTYPAEVRRILDLALNLTTQNLGYKYGSADPAKGGMDGSGFIYYVLAKCGMKDVPRDARDQYIWVRKAGNFQAVLAHRDDSFELDALKPGDLLFWASTYNVSREPAITHTMIYVGREKGTNQRIMVGASEGRTYKAQPRLGVSILDFKVGRINPKSSEAMSPVFVGYGRVPGLRPE
jgi:cell wall-associated NlpC family hydrolase